MSAAYTGILASFLVGGYLTAYDEQAKFDFDSWRGDNVAQCLLVLDCFRFEFRKRC